MKIFLRTKKVDVSQNELEVIHLFIKFLQKEIPLKKDLTISLVNDRENKMTTGIRLPQGRIEVLYGKRLMIDILRTISHEWVHEYQNQIMKLFDGVRVIKDIGGPEENMANVLSGIHIKKFQKMYPEIEDILYGE